MIDLMSKNILQTTVYASLFVQVITGIIDFYVLKLNVVPSMMILKDLLLLELIVQLIEGSFYIWLAYSFVSIENITPHRYYDWFITTPTMLITFSIYLIYLKNEYEQKLNTNTTKTINNDTDTFVQILQKNAYILIIIKSIFDLNIYICD